MTISLEVFPTIMESQRNELRAYTDSAVSGLEIRLNNVIEQRVNGVVAHLTSVIEERAKAHDTDLSGIKNEIGNKLDALSDDMSLMKAALNSWQMRSESFSNVELVVREVQAQQIGQAEALQTLQSDLYGQPARGRTTLFGMINELSETVSSIRDQVQQSSRWIEGETVRQSQIRERWHNRQRAAFALMQIVPTKALMALAVGGSATLVLILKALGG